MAQKWKNFADFFSNNIPEFHTNYCCRPHKAGFFSVKLIKYFAEISQRFSLASAFKCLVCAINAYIFITGTDFTIGSDIA